MYSTPPLISRKLLLAPPTPHSLPDAAVSNEELKTFEEPLMQSIAIEHVFSDQHLRPPGWMAAINGEADRAISAHASLSKFVFCDSSGDSCDSTLSSSRAF